jgi:FlaA1/EpsC-like NDP-sugar epimerase
LRPGEKLYEELLIGNSPQPTMHERILKAHEDCTPFEVLQERVQALREVRDRDEALSLLKKVVPEYGGRADAAVGTDG